MSGEPDLIKLYSKKILALAADLPNYAKLEHVSARAKKTLASLRIQRKC